MNNKGISLVTVIVIIIVMIIIATISIVAGNRLIFESKSLKENQEIENIREAINRLKNELDVSGTLTPKGESYIGKASPAVGNGEVRAEGWYLLDKETLSQLGIKNQQGRFLVNYDYSEVLDMSDSSYYEKYNICEFMHEEINNCKEAKINGTSYTYPGEALGNKEAEHDGKVMYSFYNDARQTETYGLGWYYVTSAQLPDKYADNVKSDYLINYDNAKYVKVTSSFVREDN